MNNIKLPGINIQAPWSRLLLDRKKQIETRTYPLPAKYLGKDLWLIETPGRLGKFKARVIGIINFSQSKLYRSSQEFYEDSDLHLISKGDGDYSWCEGHKKYGWTVARVQHIPEFNAPFPRGIVYASPFGLAEWKV